MGFSSRLIGVQAFLQNVEYTVNFRKPKFMWRLVSVFLRSIYSKTTPLRGVDIAIGYNCNLVCEHCNVDTIKEEGKSSGRTVLTPEEIAGVISQCSPSGLVNITFTGGEPLLLYKRLVKILKAFDTSSYLIHIQTNATLLTEEKVVELKKLGVDKFVLSFDPYHGADWEEMLENRVQMVKMIKRHGLKVIAVAVADRQTIYTEPFLRMIEVARKLNIWSVLNLPIPLGSWLGNEEILLNEDDQKYVRDLVAMNYHVRLDFDLNFLKYGCPAFTERFHINAFGDVQPCTFSQISFGNVREQSVAAIREKGLRNKIFNTYTRHCPPAEDRKFIASFTNLMKEKQRFPLPHSEIFDEKGELKSASSEGERAARSQPAGCGSCASASPCHVAEGGNRS